MAKKTTRRGGAVKNRIRHRLQTNLAPFDGRRVVLLLPVEWNRIPMIGTASVEHDPERGTVLRLRLDQMMEGNPEVVIAEDSWNGRVIPDLQYGCDFCFIPEAEEF